MERLIEDLISVTSIEDKKNKGWVIMKILEEVERKYLDITPQHYVYNRNKDGEGRLCFWDCVNRYRDSIIWKG